MTYAQYHLFVTAAIMLMAILLPLLWMLHRKFRKRANAISQRAEELRHMMKLSLQLTSCHAIEYDVRTNHMENKYGGTILPEEGATIEQFLDHVHPDHRALIRKEAERLSSGEVTISQVEFRMRSFYSSVTNSVWKTYHCDTMVELDKHGVPKYVVATLKDITNNIEEMERNEAAGKRFEQIFNKALVAISFYDQDGNFIDMNQKMRELVGISADDKDCFFLRAHLSEFEFIRGDFDLKGRDSLHACQHLYYPAFGVDKYIEFRMMPVYDRDELKSYIMTAVDITEDRQLTLKQKRVDEELHQAYQKVNEHEEELRNLLNSGGLWVWRSNIQEQTISFSRSLKHSDYLMTFDQFRESISEKDLMSLSNLLNNFQGTEENLNKILYLKNSPVSLSHMWCSITGIPTHDDNGRPTGHFGILRDITTLMDAQEKLRQETSRAEDSGKLKSVFLANMTHEIRTPLNAIVGFSDLLQVIESPDDRKEFIRIIRNNCDMLIRLIDDIIEASNMNQGPLHIEVQEVDFAIAFRDICQTLSQRVQEPGVQFLADNPYETFITSVDKGRLQQVITNFTTNAVKYTHQGHIKVGYRYQDKGIYMYCEDTGAGIPKEKQDAVFERFVKLNDFIQGTGLGLSICKNIAEGCGGHIGVDSEGEGHGSTFWIWIPCECRKMVPAAK